MDKLAKFKGTKPVISDKSRVGGGKDLRVITATLYAQHLVKFVLRHHGISCHSALSDEFWESLGEVFDEDVGKIVVAYARSSEKETLEDTAYAVQLLLTHGEFSAYCLEFRNLYFSNYGCSPESVFKYFAYVIEHSVLLYLEGLHDAPLTAIQMIATFLLDDKDSRFVINVGLVVLNETARRIMASDTSLKDAYESGKFAW